MAETQRLSALETDLFGQPKSGSVSSRLSEINKALGPKKSNMLLPAMAPRLDTSTEHVPTVAPSFNSAYSQSQFGTGFGAQDDEKAVLKNAMQLYAHGQTDQAEREFRKVLSMNSRSVDAYYNLGVIAEAKGDLSGAMNYYRSASNFSPGDNDLREALNGVQTKLQNQTTAQTHQREAQQRESLEAQQQAKTTEMKGLVTEAATAYKAGNYDKAIGNLETVARQAPDDADVQYALAQAYKGKGQFDLSRSALNKAISIDPSNDLYKNAMSDLDLHGPAAGSGGQSNKLTGFTETSETANTGSSNTGFQSADASSSQPAGQLTPFSGINDKPSEGLSKRRSRAVRWFARRRRIHDGDGDGWWRYL